MPVYVGLPTSGDPTRANALGRAFLADILAVMADLTSERRPAPVPPFLILLDEFASYAVPEFAEMFRKAREAHVQIVAAVTNISDLQDRHKGLSPEYPDMLTGNASVLFMGSESPWTLEFAERYFGQEKQLIQSYRESLANNMSGHLASAEERFFNPMQGTSRTVFDQATEKREPRLEKEILNRLRLHQAIGFFRARPTLINLVHYFVPQEIAAQDPIKAVPLLPKVPREPVALAEYVQERQIETAKVWAGKKKAQAAAPAQKPAARQTKRPSVRKKKNVDPPKEP
jgi:hypothetical protein